ncbi:unnamed protein product, partial [Hapterophycus canaliculatus]
EVSHDLPRVSKRGAGLSQDTEFPGVVARPVGDFNQPDFQYQTLR